MSKQIIADRFAEADLEIGRFVKVKDGQKMCVDHDTRYNDPNEVPGNNYGIYSMEDDQLVVLDVDAHRGGEEEVDKKAVLSLGRLGLTLTIQSPHADEDVGGHRLFKLEGDETPAELFNRVFGRKNPVPSWGEVVSKNKYVVGPGSVLYGCNKDWCDECRAEDGGRYVVKHDREIASVSAEDLITALDGDPDLDRQDQPDHSDLTKYEGSGKESSKGSKSADYDDLTRSQVEDLLEEVPGDQHFDNWIRTGYAVHSWDSGEVGKEVFEEWSRNNKKWVEQESQRQIDYIWENGDPSNSDHNASIGTLIHIARENGYEGDLGGKVKEPETGAEITWADVRGMYAYAEQEQDYPKGNARKAAADLLEEETSWMYVLESEKLWMYDDSTGQYLKHGASYISRRLERKLEEFYKQTEQREITARIEARNQVHRQEINARQRDDPLVCVGNGVINLSNGELLDHSPDFRFIRGLAVDYDPAGAEPEKIVDFLDDITERKADRDTLLDHLAHGLMPGHPYRAFVVCYGPGGNGKTQAAELFRGFVGTHNAAAVEIDELADGGFATGDLPGKFINWGDDMAGDGGGQLSDLSTLKKATGGSEIRSNEKYEKIFNFKNEAAMFFSANEPPRIGEQKRSIQDRIYPIEMPYRFTSNPDPDNPLEKEKTPNVSKLLLDDDGAMKGLLLLAVKHAQQLIENRGEYSQPESPEERLEKYNRSADPIVKFAGKALEEAGPDYRIRKDDAYRVYQKFTESWEKRAASERGFKRQFSGSIPYDVEGAQSRALASPDDGEDRVRCWKRVKWTDIARQHMPEWMVERYSDHFEDSNSQTKADSGKSDEKAAEEGGSGNSHPTFEALEPGRQTIKATIAEELPAKPWQLARGHLIDKEDNIMPYIVEGTENPLRDSFEGDKVVIENARVATDRDGHLRVELSSVCDVRSAEEPSPLTVDDRQEAGEAATDGSGETDDEGDGNGDEVKEFEGEPLAPHIMQYVMKYDGDAPREDLVEYLLDGGAAEKQIDHWIQKCLERADISQPEEGMYRR